jgi:hypothetical protein
MYWTSDTRVESVAIGDVDGDTQMEILTEGYYLGNPTSAQLCVWEYS